MTPERKPEPNGYMDQVDCVTHGAPWPCQVTRESWAEYVAGQKRVRSRVADGVPVWLAIAAERDRLTTGAGTNIDGSTVILSPAMRDEFALHGLLDSDGQLKPEAREQGLRLASKYRAETEAARARNQAPH